MIRGAALVVAGTTIAGAALLVTEAVAAVIGSVASQPVGQSDAVVGIGDPPPVQLVVLGDSTGAAVGAGDVALGYARRVAEALAAAVRRRVDLRVLAVSGARVADVRAEQLPSLSRLRPDLVLVVVGGNDVTHITRINRARTDLAAVIGSASASGAPVVVAGIPAMGTARRFMQPLRFLVGVLAARYDDAWRQETARAGVSRVELAASTEGPFRENPSLLSADGFHPSAAGYAVWTQAIAPVVIEAVHDFTR